MRDPKRILAIDQCLQVELNSFLSGHGGDPPVSTTERQGLRGETRDASSVYLTMTLQSNSDKPTQPSDDREFCSASFPVSLDQSWSRRLREVFLLLLLCDSEPLRLRASTRDPLRSLDVTPKTAKSSPPPVPQLPPPQQLAPRYHPHRLRLPRPAAAPTIPATYRNLASRGAIVVTVCADRTLARTQEDLRVRSPSVRAKKASGSFSTAYVPSHHAIQNKAPDALSAACADALRPRRPRPRLHQ